MDDALIKTEKVGISGYIEGGPKRSSTHKRRKGYNKEKMARDELVKEGWEIAFKSIRFRFGGIDFSNLYDVVAIKGHEWRFISVKNKKATTKFPAHVAEILAYAEAHGLLGQSYELWAWDAPKWKGRGKNKAWNVGGWTKKVIWEGRTLV